MLVRAGLLAATGMLAFAATAMAGGAATRFAEPGGNGAEPCLTGDPCSLQDAVEDAPLGALVLLKPGVYAETDTVSVANNVDVQPAEDGEPDGVVIESTAAIAVHVAFSSTSSQLNEFTIDHSSTAPSETYGLQLEGGTAERLFVHSDGAVDITCYVTGLLRDSVCENASDSGGSAAGFFSPVDLTGKLVNVTAVATSATGTGVFLSATTVGADAVLTARNVIAQGAGQDQFVNASNVGTADLDLANSNFDTLTVVNGATGTLATENDNQSGPPLLDSGYRQLPGSPTIDGGDSSEPALGNGDIDFGPRVENGVVDIGADESDGVAPDTEITKNPPKRTKKRTGAFEFESDELGSGFDCKIDGKPFKPCDSGAVKYKRLTRKKHTFQVRADDGFNVDATPDTYTWKIRKKK